MKRTPTYLSRVGCAAGVFCALLVTVGLQATAQDVAQTGAGPQDNANVLTQAPAPPVQQVRPIQEFNPVQVIKPVVPVVPGIVNATGGIINSHPQDIFNQGNTVQQPAETSEKVDTYRVESVIETQPNVSDMNSNAASVQNHDHWHRPFNLGIEANNVLTSNLFNDFHSATQTSGDYLDLAFPLGFQFATPTTNFGIYFRETSTFYPSYSSLNHHSEIYSQNLEHKTSDITTWNWSAAGGRIVTVNEYLPTFISIGTTGVAQNSLSNGLLPLYNAASTLSVTHRLDDRDTLLASATGGWMQEPLNYGTSTQTATLSREAMGAGDVQLQRAMNPMQAVGVELTNIYVKGLSPVGASNFTSLKMTFQQAISQHGSLHVGVGPLYSHAASVLYPTENDFSYTADIGLDYQTSFARMSGGYARIFQLGYLAPATAAHRLYGVFDRPITRKMGLTVDASYFSAIAPKSYNAGNYSDFGFTSRLGYDITPQVVAFVSGSVFRQSAPAGTNLGRNDFTTGITYTFGNPVSRSGGR